jgi:hypothetical protein
MQKIVELFLIVVAVASVALADSVIKAATSHARNISEALTNPLMLLAVFLYLLQILIFSYVFVKKWELGIVGSMQMIMYGLIVIMVGIVFFQEKVGLVHGIGLVLALISAVLMNLPA